MIKDHVHQWIPLSKANDVLVTKECLFVCKDCSAFEIRIMRRIEKEAE